jgi:hypothetical protein
LLLLSNACIAWDACSNVCPINSVQTFLPDMIWFYWSIEKIQINYHNKCSCSFRLLIKALLTCLDVFVVCNCFTVQNAFVFRVLSYCLSIFRRRKKANVKGMLIVYFARHLPNNKNIKKTKEYNYSRATLLCLVHKDVFFFFYSAQL